MKLSTYLKNRKILASLIMLVAVIAVLITEVVAWFITSNGDNIIDNITGTVIGEDDIDNTIDVEILEGGVDAALTLEVIPAHFAKLKITIANVSDTAKRYKISFGYVNVVYPSSRGYVYREKNILTGDYWNVLEGEYFDESAVPSGQLQDFFKQFVMPVTNAVQYGVYTADTDIFHTEYVPSYITNQTEAPTADQLLDTKGVTMVSKDAPLHLPIVDNGTLGTVDASGNILVPANGSQFVYLLLYFDEDKYSTTTYNSEQVQLQNSNCYLAQQFNTTITYEVVG